MMDAGPLVVLLGLLFVKESGLPVPVPGDLLVLGAGVAAAGQGPTAIGILAAILIAGYLGGALQFVLVRDALRGPMLTLLTRLGVPLQRLEALAERLRSGGSGGVAIARATPGVRIGAIAASGLAVLPFNVFAPGLVAGNTLFVGGHFALGYLLGAPVVSVIAGAGGLAVVIVGVLVLAALGVLGFRRLVASRRFGRGQSADALAPIQGGWADAACPACLLLDALGR